MVFAIHFNVRWPLLDNGIDKRILRVVSRAEIDLRVVFTIHGLHHLQSFVFGVDLGSDLRN